MAAEDSIQTHLIIFAPDRCSNVHASPSLQGYLVRTTELIMAKNLYVCLEPFSPTSYFLFSAASYSILHAQYSALITFNLIFQFCVRNSSDILCKYSCFVRVKTIVTYRETK